MAVIITTDWKLEEVARRTYGVCQVSWSPPFDKFDFERGFALPNPTSVRVAAQALVWALEAIDNCTWINKGRDAVVVATKHRALHEMLSDPNRVSKWMASGKWPRGHAPARALVAKCRSIMDSMASTNPDFLTLVYIEREEGDSAFVDLDANRTDEGFDMESFVKKETPQDEIEKKLQETRMNGVMFNKLMTSGARCYRQKAK